MILHIGLTSHGQRYEIGISEISSRAVFKNRKFTLHWTCLRKPWQRACSSSLTGFRHMTDPNASDGYARVQTAVTFLDHVLPRTGFRIAYVVQGKKKFNAFFKTNLELAQAIIRWDDGGATAYHACASFKVNQHGKDLGRTQRNVLAARGPWGD